MRKGWEYKKLGEVCALTMGQSPDGNSINEVNGIEFHQGKTCFGERFLGISPLYSNAPTKLAEAHSVLLCVRAPVGYPNITDRKICIGRGLCALYAKREIDNSFLYYSLLGKQSYFEKNATGSTFKAISSKIVSNTTLSIPPLSTQLAIVSELDKINELIRLKKEQLKDFDNLAQSLFYEMFGDPVENEKGWEVKKLGEICEIFAGGDKPKDMCEIQNNEYIYPVIANGEGEKGILGYTKNCRVTKEAVTIGARGASIGNCRIVKNGFTPAIRLLTLIPTGSIDCCFLYYFVKDLNYKQNGAGQAQLTVPNIKCEFIPLPPLSLQRLFAQRIEQIEREKSEVQKSIQNLETLLASRMQYWFE